MSGMSTVLRDPRTELPTRRNVSVSVRPPASRVASRSMSSLAMVQTSPSPRLGETPPLETSRRSTATRARCSGSCPEGAACGGTRFRGGTSAPAAQWRPYARPSRRSCLKSRAPKCASGPIPTAKKPDKRLAGFAHLLRGVERRVVQETPDAYGALVRVPARRAELQRAGRSRGYPGCATGK
eukprot:scaffold8232_cov191-Pinguiococcus_pyrenoidosus.AAC.3